MKMSSLMGISVPLVPLMESGSFLSSFFFALIYIENFSIFFLLEFLLDVHLSIYFSSYVHKTLHDLALNYRLCFALFPFLELYL